MSELRKQFGTPPGGGWKIRRDSFSKLWMVIDGKTLTFHSLDWPSTTSKVRDQALGIARFERLLTRPLYSRFEIARIYDSLTNEVLAEYKHGAKVL